MKLEHYADQLVDHLNDLGADLLNTLQENGLKYEPDFTFLNITDNGWRLELELEGGKMYEVTFGPYETTVERLAEQMNREISQLLGDKE